VAVAASHSLETKGEASFVEMPVPKSHHATEEFVNTAGDLATLVGKRAVAAVEQMQLGPGRHAKIPLLVVER